MIQFTSTASDHIQFLLQNLDASNLDSVSRELCEYTAYIVDQSIILIRAFLDRLNINGNKRKNVELESVFASVFKNILNKSSFSTVFCEALVNTSPSQDFLEKLSDIVHLSTSERIGIGLALSCSENIDFRMCGNDFCLSQIVELCPQRMCGISADRIHQILLFLNQSKGLYEHLDAFMQLLSLSQLDGEVQFILFPFISDELHEPKILRKLHFLKEDGEDYFDSLLSEMEKETSIADVMKELGYSCTANVSQCKKTLSLFSPLTEVTIARVVGTISRNHVGLEDSQNIFSAFRTVTGDSGFSDTTSLNSWNPEVLVDSIKQLAPGINWTNVFENLDHEDFYIPSNESFAYFMSVYKHVCQDPFPLHVICGSVWKNIKGQISFLKYAVSVPPEEFTFALSGRQLGDMDVLNGLKLQLGKGNHAWSCLDLLEVLCLVAERGHANTVRSILEYPVKHCPEVLLLGMAHVNTAYNLIQKEVSSAIFTGILNNVPGSDMLLHLWHVNPSMLLWGFTDTLNVNQESVFRILDVCQELKILSQVLDMLPSFFGIRLAAVSSAKELLDLEKWLITNFTAYKDAFYEECLRFLKEVQAGAQEVSANQLQPSGGLYSTFSETCSTFLKVLQSHAGNLSSHHLYEEMENLYASYLDIVRSNNTVDIDSSTTDGYADDIEAEANSYFHQVFSGQLTIDGIVQILTRLKESPETRENLIFECMIANLFEEYKSFSEYPEIQLKIAAVLFGSLIKHQLVTHISLGVALWAILHALCKPADSKMFVFGEKALEQFLDRLTEWPQYCNYILQISHLRANHSDLVAFVERALARISSAHSKPDPLHGGSVDHQSPNQTQLTNSEMPVSSCHFTGSGASHLQLQVPSSLQHPKRQQHGLVKGEVTPSLTKYVKPTTSSAGQFYCTTSSDISEVKPQNVVNTSVPVRPSSSLFRPPHGITHAGFGSALNIETLVAAAERRETPIEAPASEIQDNISFIINNLSDMNIEDKAKEVRDILKEQYFPWFAQYIVMKRASIEANFHDLYLKFFDKLNSKLLNKEILQVTYENCKVLLGSELIKSSSEERSLLKNLGSWLGKITIGRNQFLRALDIDPKSLILEAYERGLMIAVIPFISKILEPCLSSIAYRPPNPWTMGILGLLAEIYALPNLKMNLKFDIQVLFKNLGVDMKDVSQTSLVKHRVREVEGNPDFSIIDVGYSQQLVGEVKSSMILNKIQIEVPPEVIDSVLPGKHARVLPQIQYAAPLDKASVSFSEDEKLLAVRSSDQLPHAQLRSQLAEPASIIEQQVVVNPTLHASGLHLPFRSALTIAMDRAIKEIVLNIVHRTVSVANQTTKELVLKDYAMEADENRIHSAAHLMVTCLAGSLIHVTCKEPLRNSISIQLRNSLQGLNIASELLEHAVLLMTNDNLDLGCAVIEQAAKKEATHAINGEMAQLLSVRRKHREGVGPMFFDTSLYAQGYRRNLPEAPCPKPGHLSLSQQQVYEVSLLFDEWHQICCNHALASDTATALYVSKLQKTGLLKGDETTDRFFHLLTEISISRYLSTEVVSSSPSPSFCEIDIYAKLVYCIVKFSPLDQGFSKFYLLSKVLAVTWKFIHQDAEKRKIHFNPRPYSRLFIKWILDLCSLDPVSDGATFQVLTSLANALHALQPLKVPGFSFAWLEVVSHRSFMPKLLTCNAEKGWPYFQRLLLDLFQFMEPFLRNAALGESTRLLYLGTLRVLLVLHHDFPEFLCDYHLSFCDVIPSSCIQMRNIILSAYPRNMRLPDPSTPNSKIGLLFEMNQSPRTLSDVDAALKAKQMKNDVDEYLKTRQQGSAFLGGLKLKLLLSPNEAAQAGTPYNVPLINSLVLYVGMQAIQLPQTRNPPNDQSMISNLSQAVSLVDAALDIFQTLITDLDTEGRYLFLNAVADQLRYPNNHTNYFSSIIRHLFAESNQEVIQEQIIRVLLERVVVNRPHPWGLLVTCSELIKDPRYKLWSRSSFIMQVPEIEKLLELAERYCRGSNHVDESVI